MIQHRQLLEYECDDKIIASIINEETNLQSTVPDEE